MPKVIITGNTRGIGLAFNNHFLSKGWKVVGFNTSTGLENVLIESTDCDLFINNAYANGIQIDFLNKLHNTTKMIICGSIAAFNPDPKLPLYSKHKKELLDRFRELSNPNILMLNLSAKGYNDPDALLKITDLWLEHPVINEISFDPTGEPNG